MPKDTFEYDPKTEPLQPVILQIKEGKFPFKIRCKNRGKALLVSQRLYKIFNWYRDKFEEINEKPPNFPALSIKKSTGHKSSNFFVHISEKAILGVMVTKEGKNVEIKSGKQNWDYEKEVREI